MGCLTVGSGILQLLLGDMGLTQDDYFRPCWPIFIRFLASAFQTRRHQAGTLRSIPPSSKRPERTHQPDRRITLRCMIPVQQKSLPVWDELLPDVEFTSNTSKSAMAGHSPFELLYEVAATKPERHRTKSYP